MNDILVLSQKEYKTFKDRLNYLGEVEDGVTYISGCFGGPTDLSESMLVDVLLSLEHKASTLGGHVLVPDKPKIIPARFVGMKGKVYAWKPISKEDGEKAIQKLTTTKNISVEKIRKIMIQMFVGK